MRISDWSSDVCSSDLCPLDHAEQQRNCRRRQNGGCYMAQGGRAGSSHCQEQCGGRYQPCQRPETGEWREGKRQPRAWLAKQVENVCHGLASGHSRPEGRGGGQELGKHQKSAEQKSWLERSGEVLSPPAAQRPACEQCAADLQQQIGRIARRARTAELQREEEVGQGGQGTGLHIGGGGDSEAD